MAIPRHGHRVGISLGLVTCVLLAAPGGPAADGGKSGFRTGQPSMLTPVMPGVTAQPIITVGDTLSSGFRFEAIPDGIAVRSRGKGRVDLYVNHETGKVPFPYNPRARPQRTARTTSTTPS